MQTVLMSSGWRKGCRRAVRTICQCVTSETFRLVGTEVLDLSPHGLLLKSDSWAEVGEEGVLSLRAPGGEEWLDAIGRVARVVKGQRATDDGIQVGIEFTEISLDTRFRLRCYLRDIPPPVPQRSLREETEAVPLATETDRAASVRTPSPTSFPPLPSCS